ncbi:sideroflexin-4 [Nematolebias whitei]|uniref:sideroflexin-4 n=1 Tax=Nematolebias whitei TaxID=451745 RepID=UPI001897EF76|nr:sideroflexin-4 [Nematolebias whitei]
MDPNLLQWRQLGQSFVHRLQTWVSVLDPSLLLSSDPEIVKAHDALLAGGQQLSEKEEAAVILSLSSVHADSGSVIPLAFRPPAYFPVLGPLVVCSFLPHNVVRHALFLQFLLQSYNAGFNFVNRNCSAEQGKKASLKQLLLVSGTILNTTIAGALPQIFITSFSLSSPLMLTLCRSFLPVPLSASLAAFSVFTIRSEESVTGIQLFDQSGNPIGFSRAAGDKAVRETALSRAVLFGTTAAVPNLLVLLLRRTRWFRRTPLLLTPCYYLSTGLVLSMMVPLSFSLFPQLGSIRREQVEEELLAGAAGEEFFFHRGL